MCKWDDQFFSIPTGDLQEGQEPGRLKPRSSLDGPEVLPPKLPFGLSQQSTAVFAHANHLVTLINAPLLRLHLQKVTLLSLGVEHRHWSWDQNAPGGSDILLGLRTSGLHCCLWKSPFEMRGDHIPTLCSPLAAANTGTETQRSLRGRAGNSLGELARWGLTGWRASRYLGVLGSSLRFLKRNWQSGFLRGNKLATNSLSKNSLCGTESTRGPDRAQGQRFATLCWYIAPAGSGKLAITQYQALDEVSLGRGPKGETFKASMLSRCVPRSTEKQPPSSQNLRADDFGTSLADRGSLAANLECSGNL